VEGHGEMNGLTARRQILPADDAASVRETLARALESEHYRVIVARNGNEAAAKFVSSLPDLVSLDLNMPERDGWSAFRLTVAAQRPVPIIVITALPHQYEQSVGLGVDALMEEPLNLPVFLGAIKNLLSESKAERTRRLNSCEFKTVDLKHSTRTSGNGEQA